MYRIRKFAPRKVVYSLQSEVDSAVEMLLADSGLTLQTRGAPWSIVVTNTRRGFCRKHVKSITIPLWAYKSGADMFLYYVAHELAHVFTRSDKHGPEFMENFKRICPPELWHFELGYKPRNAKAAGISNQQSVSIKLTPAQEKYLAERKSTNG